jgi:hypothetical protein
MRRLWCIMCLLLSVQAARAIHCGSEPAASDRRYDAVGGILTVQNPNVFGSAVLIAPNMILTAAHVVHNKAGLEPGWPEYPQSYYKVRFRRLPDGTLGNYDATVHHWISLAPSVTQDDLGDAVVGVLDQPISTNHIVPMRISHRRYPVSGTAGRDPCSVRIAGWGLDENGQNGHLRTAATNTLVNQIGRVYDDQVFYPTFSAQGCPQPGPDLGDSGGAIAIEDCFGQPILIGVIRTPELGNSLYKAFGIPGFGRILFDPSFNFLDLNGDGLLTNKDRNAFLSAYVGAIGYRGLCSDFNDDGTLTHQDYLAFMQAFMAANGTYCPADANLDGVVNASDFDAFRTAYDNHLPQADLDFDGQFTQSDWAIFVQAYSQGCP